MIFSSAPKLLHHSQQQHHMIPCFAICFHLSRLLFQHQSIRLHPPIQLRARTNGSQICLLQAPHSSSSMLAHGGLPFQGSQATPGVWLNRSNQRWAVSMAGSSPAKMGGTSKGTCLSSMNSGVTLHRVPAL